MQEEVLNKVINQLANKVANLELENAFLKAQLELLKEQEENQE